MKKSDPDALLGTGVRNLDAVFHGGLPRGSVSVVSGPPGSGKTILTQQLCFNAASPENRILYFNTLSEPTAKTLRYLKPFSFFDPTKMEKYFQFVDLGVIFRSKGLGQTTSLIMDRIKEHKPSIVVIDSFKAFDDLSKSREELRKFGYELAINLMAWEVNGLLLGEYGATDYTENPLFSVVDGLITLTQRESSGEQQRFLQVIKMRGSDHSRDPHSFVITSNGIEVFAPRITLRRESREAGHEQGRCKTGILKLDDLLGEGIPRGSSLLISGVAGTGKTALLLEFIYRGALLDEKGIVFSFEETPERLIAAARGLGWDLEREIARGMIELVFIAQPDILVEGDLLMMRERIATSRARRVAIDSVSVFLHKVKDPQVGREKIFQLATIVQNSSSVGFFATDVPYGSNAISRFGVEETVVDGVILLSSTEEGFERQRYIEIYKLRNTAHSKGRHSMMIGKGGIQVFPRYDDELLSETPPPPLEMGPRLSSGIPALDVILGGGLLKRSATILAGSPGIGKSTFGLQFLLEGAARNEPGLLFTLEESPQQILATADAMDLPLRKWVDKGLIEIVYLSNERVRAAQFLTVLADKIRKHNARRLVLDSVTHIVREAPGPDGLRRLLYKLVARFKSLEVTSLLTVESSALYFGDDITERGFSPVADNLVMLRYLAKTGELCPALAVIKTRGSNHDRATFTFSIAKGGIRIDSRSDGVHAGATKTSVKTTAKTPTKSAKASRIQKRASPKPGHTLGR